MAKSIIVCHNAAASGARFSVHPSEEEFRQSLLEYHNDTLCDDDDEKLHDDAVVSEVIDAIEESENVSWELIRLPDGFFPGCWSRPDLIPATSPMPLNIAARPSTSSPPIAKKTGRASWRERVCQYV